MNIENLQKRIDGGYIRVQKHPTFDLWIYNYTEKAQFENAWDDETMSCRGLIMDRNYNVIARPFKKFFNLDEFVNKGGQLPAEEFEVFDKLDGSLGISYFWEGNFYLATRGSFTSDKAIEGTKMLNEKRKEMLLNYGVDLLPTWTYLFEIIYPENRIVVNYGDKRDIVLLAVVKTETGEEDAYDHMLKYNPCLTMVGAWYGMKDLEEIKNTQWENKEGFVIRFKSGMRVKVKFDEYVRLHRLITGINARHIWELLKNEQSFEEILTRIPDEFYKWVTDTRDVLLSDYRGIQEMCMEAMGEIGQTIDPNFEMPPMSPEHRKAFAIEVTKNYPRLSAVLFKMYDMQPYKDLIWKMLKPKAEVPFRKEI